MGLDNGIIIKNKDGSEEEICYWRKCWNVRAEIFDIIGHECEVYEYPLSLDNVVDVYYRLKTFNRRNWTENEHSIWSWNEAKRGIKEDIHQLKKLIKRMKKEPDIEVYFYDSY